MMAINLDDITGLILAGGQGARMGNADKGLQLLHGEPLVLHAVQRMRPQAGRLVLNANRNHERYAAFGLPVIADPAEGFQGPLAGVQSGLRHCQTTYLVTAPCDSPFLPRDLVARLAHALHGREADVAFAVTGNAQARQPQPVFALMRTDVLPSLEAFLQRGSRKIEQWQRSLRHVEVDFPDASAFANINTLDELDQHETR